MPRYGAGVILTRKDEVLLVRHGEKSRNVLGLYTLPGGETESYDKDSMDTVIREVCEETGLIINRKNLRLLGHYIFFMQRRVGKEEMSIDLYSCKKFKGVLKSGEETEPVWVKSKKFISGEYQLPYTSGNFLADVFKFLKE